MPSIKNRLVNINFFGKLNIKFRKKERIIFSYGTSTFSLQILMSTSQQAKCSMLNSHRCVGGVTLYTGQLTQYRPSFLQTTASSSSPIPTHTCMHAHTQLHRFASIVHSLVRPKMAANAFGTRTACSISSFYNSV